MIIHSYLDKFKSNKNIVTESGSPVTETYEYDFIDGNKTLVKSGVVNTQDYIESFRKESDIHNILNRFINGDEAIISARKGTFIDITDIPDNFIDAHKYATVSKSFFESLDPKIREKYNNSYEEFYSSPDSFKFVNDFYNSPDLENIEDTKKGEITDAE